MHAAPFCWLTLRNARQFGVVMQQGQVVARSKHFMLHALRWQQTKVRASDRQSSCQEQPFSGAIFSIAQACPRYCGAIIPKRWARRAVTRNLIKRQIRQALSAYVPALPDGEGLALVLRWRAAFDPQQFVSASSPALRQAVRQELLQLLGKTDWRAATCLPAPPSMVAASLPRQRQQVGTAHGTSTANSFAS